MFSILSDALGCVQMRFNDIYLAAQNLNYFSQSSTAYWSLVFPSFFCSSACPNIEGHKDGDTLLTLATKLNEDSSHEAVIQILLENGADVNARNSEGDTALLIACRESHTAHLARDYENHRNARLMKLRKARYILCKMKRMSRWCL